MLTTAEACERLRISDKTLRKLIKSGAIRATRAGTGRSSGYRITEEAINEFLEAQTVKPAS